MDDVKTKRTLDGSIDAEAPIAPGYSGRDVTINPKVHKRALLKLDLILLSTVTLIYFLNFLDRYVLS